jgi:hypothetical protein
MTIWRRVYCFIAKKCYVVHHLYWNVATTSLAYGKFSERTWITVVIYLIVVVSKNVDIQVVRATTMNKLPY